MKNLIPDPIPNTPDSPDYPEPEVDYNMVDIDLTIGTMVINPDKPDEYIIEMIAFIDRVQLNDMLSKQRDRRVKAFIKNT